MCWNNDSNTDWFGLGMISGNMIINACLGTGSVYYFKLATCLLLILELPLYPQHLSMLLFFVLFLVPTITFADGTCAFFVTPPMMRALYTYYSVLSTAYCKFNSSCWVLQCRSNGFN